MISNFFISIFFFIIIFTKINNKSFCKKNLNKIINIKLKKKYNGIKNNFRRRRKEAFGKKT
jgi:hypothetical protein